RLCGRLGSSQGVGVAPSHDVVLGHLRLERDLDLHSLTQRGDSLLADPDRFRPGRSFSPIPPVTSAWFSTSRTEWNLACRGAGPYNKVSRGEGSLVAISHLAGCVKHIKAFFCEASVCSTDPTRGRGATGSCGVSSVGFSARRLGRDERSKPRRACPRGA